jgi:choline-sulfatase
MPVASAKHSRPNLVLFMPDELRANALACYGNPLAKTPNYDKLAAGGTQFSNCHV